MLGMTILFEKDWLLHPNATIDYNTKNESFLRLAEIYHAMGVRNCAFHLSLLQPELAGIDPYSENLDITTKAKIVYECKSNFWYFLREVSKVPVPGSLLPVSFSANRGNIALYWYFLNHVMTIIVILRQTGKTTSLTTLATYLLNFGTTNTFINLLTKSEALKADTLSKVKELFAELPDYLNFSTKKDIFNSDEANVKELGNKLKGNLSSSSRKQAEKVGRGFTSPINLIDEIAYIENIAIAMGAMLMSGNAARAMAKELGKPYGTILATTAGDIEDRDGKYIYSLINGATVHDEHFFDSYDLTELLDNIYKNSNASKNSSKRPIVNISLSYRQLGYTEDWLKERLEENISTPENIRRDIFGEWGASSSTSPIPREYVENMRNGVIEVPRSYFYPPYNYLLRWYISEEEDERRRNTGVHYIVGIDTSDGVGRDDIAFIVRDHTTGEIICTAVFNEINLITLADYFVSFLLKYTNSTMILERRSSAATIIDYIIQKLLQYNVNPYSRLYNTIYQNKEQYSKEYNEIVAARYHDDTVFIKYKKHIGFVTSGSGITSRSELYSTTLISMLRYTSSVIYDQQLVTQISGLVVRNNRIDHPEGGRDDMVIASLLSYWMLITGKHLDLYGIPSSSILKANRAYLIEKYKETDIAENEEEAAKIEDEFNGLLEQYKKEKNPIIARQLELRIKKLSTETSYNKTIISVEEMLSNIAKEKRIQRL